MERQNALVKAKFVINEDENFVGGYFVCTVRNLVCSLYSINLKLSLKFI